jgi:hypothetical protein
MPSRKWTRTQLLLTLGVYLLLGEVVNGAVAWGCAFRLEPDSHWSLKTDPIASSLESHPIPHKWSVLVRHQFGVSKVISVRSEVDGFKSLQITSASPESLLPRWARINVATGDDARTRVFEAFGWPMISMVGGCEYRYEFLGGSDFPWMRFMTSFEIPNRYRDVSLGQFPNVVFMPLRPLWPGFAINTIFYAAMLWLLWVAPGKIRRFVRVRAHRCPACGYRIAEGVGPNCSECGAQLPAALRLAFQ